MEISGNSTNDATVFIQVTILLIAIIISFPDDRWRTYDHLNIPILEFFNNSTINFGMDSLSLPGLSLDRDFSYLRQQLFDLLGQLPGKIWFLEKRSTAPIRCG